MGKEYLLLWAQTLSEFRLPELRAICELLDIEISYDAEAINLDNPFMRAVLPSDTSARMLASRCILLRGIYELWAQAPTYEEIFQTMQTNIASQALWQPYHAERTSFRFDVFGYCARLSRARKKQIIESFHWMGYPGRIAMDDPGLRVTIIEDWPDPMGCPNASVREMQHVWVGKWICDGQRHLLDTFNLKKRVYIGNTSMEAELSLIMANMAKACPGKLLYDPFVGTGSMLYTSAFFGAFVMGSDIDGRQFKGKRGKSAFDSADQYGVREKILDFCAFDLTQNPFRIGGFVDAIITDPPYGVRAGAKRLGRTDETKLRNAAYQFPDGTYSHELPDYIPPSKPWEMSEVLKELLRQSLWLLRPGGRLVYWFPTVTAEYKESDVPRLKGFRMIANSEQNFGKWARRLITMEKLTENEAEEVATEDMVRPSDTLPAHYDFRSSFHARFDRSKEAGANAHASADGIFKSLRESEKVHAMHVCGEA